jgi:hypothetical protein
MMWFLSGYLLVAAAFYGYISATAAEDPYIGVDERGLTTYTQSTEDLRKAA